VCRCFQTPAIIDRFAGLVRELELNWTTGLLLSDCRTLDSVASWRNILDFERYHIATAQLAIDR
jgi:hypothetical protein